jgi:cytidylate kinase
MGERLSSRLNALYLDREIISRAAEKLRVSEEYLEAMDEKNTSFWQSFLLSSTYDSPNLFIPSSTPAFLSEQDLYQVEKEIITHLAEKRMAVIVGRAGSYILRDHPRHVSLYLYADISVRCVRVQSKYNLPVDKALKMIEENDRSRSRYLHNITGVDWNDARQYHLCIDTGAIDLLQTENIVLNYLQTRFGPLEIRSLPEGETSGKK